MTIRAGLFSLVCFLLTALLLPIVIAQTPVKDGVSFDFKRCMGCAITERELSDALVKLADRVASNTNTPGYTDAAVALKALGVSFVKSDATRLLGTSTDGDKIVVMLQIEIPTGKK